LGGSSTSSSGTVVFAMPWLQSAKNCAAPSLIHEWHRHCLSAPSYCVSTLGRSVGASVLPFHVQQPVPARVVFP
jgi:hypothetical protein